MLQTIYESESCFSSDGVSGREQFLAQHRMHNMISSVELKPGIPSGLESVTPLDLRTDLRMMMPGVDTTLQEKQLQQELLLIQKQQQIQKQLLITEFQKQHENLMRQHQAQLQEHMKLQQELLFMKQQQELLEKERKLEQLRQEQEMELQRREQQFLSLRGRGRESAMASTEVKQKLQEFLLSKSKDPAANGNNHSLGRHPKLWYMAAHHTSLDQSSPPLGATPPSYKYTLPGTHASKDDFPLRKTASEPNLKVRSRLKQKVAERRSSPLLRRKDGNVINPYKKRTCDVTDTSVSSSAPGSGPSSPNSGCTGIGPENSTSVLPTTAHTEAATTLKEQHGDSAMQAMRQALPGQYLGAGPLLSGLPPVALEAKANNSHQALLQHLLLKEQMRQQKSLTNGAVTIHPQSPLAMKDRPASSVRHKLPRHRPLNRTQSAPLPQSTLAHLVIQQQHQQFLEKQKQYQQQVQINKAATTLKEQHGDSAMQAMRQALPGQYLGAGPLLSGLPPVALEAKANNSHQALLQHLLLKEQMRQQKSLTNGAVTIHPQSPLAMKDRPASSVRHKLPRHRPLNRTQSAPLPQSTLAHLVIQQQHQQFLEKQKQYQQQVQINKMLSKSIEQLRQPSSHLEETEEENHKDQPMQEDKVPPCGSIMNCRSSSSSSSCEGEVPGAHLGVIKVKEEPPDSDDESLSNQSEAAEQTVFMQKQLQEHQGVHQLRLYQAQTTAVDITGLEKHQPVSRTQSSPAASALQHQLPDQPVIHSFTTGSSYQKHLPLLPCGGLGICFSFSFFCRLFAQVDSDTIWNELHSSSTARMAVGCVIELASKVASRELKNGFAVVQPPGHHAEESTAMMFTMAMEHSRPFFSNPNVLYMSLHCYDEGNFFPGSGAPDECGSHVGEGYNVNIAWTGGLEPPMGDVEYLTAFRSDVISHDIQGLLSCPIATEFNPDVVLVSAGFDAVEGHDPPLGGYKVTAKCFGHLTRQLMKLANGRVVLALEGGHDLTSICDASEACVNALLGNELEPLPVTVLHAKPNANAVTSIEKTITIQSKYWRSVQKYTSTVNCSVADAQQHKKEETDTVTAMASLTVDADRQYTVEEIR
ncbi:Histone deacetylase 9 [Acipenser ruthenus]|uniref:Histone deacetylase n=1 Tax=Acipenser ruthenus TaxID=7906 RepID=A0A444UPX8_ACIRT|nr:Histone deacetylase 9 [Acipenser ruthenus]